MHIQCPPRLLILMKSLSIMFGIMLLSCVAQKSRAAPLPLQNEIVINNATFAEDNNGAVFSPSPVVESTKKSNFSTGIVHFRSSLHLRVKDLTSSITRSMKELQSILDIGQLPEESIESQFLQFLKRNAGDFSHVSRWKKHRRRSRRLSRRRKRKSSKASSRVVNRNTGVIPAIDNSNRTVRPGISGHVYNARKPFRSMPINAEDLIRGIIKAPRTGESNGEMESDEEHDDDNDEEGDDDEDDDPEDQETGFSAQTGTEHVSIDESPESEVSQVLNGVNQRQKHEVNTAGATPFTNTFMAKHETDVSSEDRSSMANAIPVGSEPHQNAQASISVKEDMESQGHSVNNAAEIGTRIGGHTQGHYAETKLEGTDPPSGSSQTKNEASSSSGKHEEGARDGKREDIYLGSKMGMINGENSTQLSLMVYKIAKSERIFSMAAAPCRAVSSWMPEVVMRLEFELPGFEFYCVDTSKPERSMADLKLAFGDVTGGFIHTLPEAIDKALPKNIDLVVSWTGMQEWGIRKSWRFIKGLRRSGARMALFSNNPKSSNAGPSEGTLNIRKSPLLFNAPQRVIGRVSNDDNKQLLLYSMDGLRDGF